MIKSLRERQRERKRGMGRWEDKIRSSSGYGIKFKVSALHLISDATNKEAPYILSPHPSPRRLRQINPQTSKESPPRALILRNSPIRVGVFNQGEYESTALGRNVDPYLEWVTLAHCLQNR